MGILAKKNMLYLLAFCIGISLLTQTFVFADDRSLGFFKEENTYSQAEDCEPCIKEPSALNLDLKKKTDEIAREAIDNFAGKDKKLDNEIILFVDPEHQFSNGAVDTLVKFKRDHPGWKVKGVILSELRGLKTKLLKKKNYFSSDVEFSIDLNGNKAREFSVTRTPAYVVIYHGRRYKIAGQPDLNDVLSRLDK